MSELLYDALEDCLAAMRRGEAIDSCLARHPDLADDLRPLLAAAAQAEFMAVESVPPEVARRGRARLLNQAAELRERAQGRSRAAPPVGLRFRRSLRLAVSVFAALIFAFVAGGVGLVFASSDSLPGDPLYGLKLSWEDIRLRWATSPRAREVLEHRFEAERLGEIGELIKKGRAEEVKFIGSLTGIFPDHIVVSDVTVLLRPETEIEGELVLGAMLKVEGFTLADGSLVGTEIKVLGSPSPLEDDGQGGRGEDPGSGGNSGPSDDPDETEESGSGAESFDTQGTLTSAGENEIVVAGKTIHLTDSTEIRGTLTQGVSVRARGYIDASGAFIATRVEVISSGSGGGGGDGDDAPEPTATSSSGGDDSGSGGGDDGDNSGSGGGDDDDHSGSATPTPTPDG